MRQLRPLFCCAAFASIALSQSLGTIAGTVTGPDGSRIPGAPVQARNSQADAAFKTISSAEGEYSLTQLPAGAYDLSVKMPGFRFAPFVKPGVTLGSSESLRIDIRLPDGNLGTLGDDPFSDLAFIRAKAERLSGPVPRAADGKPDLSGVWNGNDDPFPEDALALPWAAERARERVQNNLKDLPRSHCLPAGVLPTGPFFRKFVQTPGLLLMINDNDVIGFRQIFQASRRSWSAALYSSQLMDNTESSACR